MLKIDNSQEIMLSLLRERDVLIQIKNVKIPCVGDQHTIEFIVNPHFRFGIWQEKVKVSLTTEQLQKVYTTIGNHLKREVPN